MSTTTWIIYSIFNLTVIIFFRFFLYNFIPQLNEKWAYYRTSLDFLIISLQIVIFFRYEIVFHLPAIWSVAFRLNTLPAVFLATHQYTPPSCSFLLCIVRRKNNEPDGNKTRCDLLSFGLVLTSSPSLNHSIDGSGFPSALQFNVTGSFFGTTMSLGCSVMRGSRYWAAKIDT